MKSFGHKLVLTMALLAALALATTAVADKSWKQVPNADEVVFDESFTFDGSPELKVDLHDLDIRLVHGEKGSARVQVEVKTRDRDRAEDYFEDLRFRARIDGDELVVETRRRTSFGWSWNRRRGVNARVIITIPNGTDMRILTSDGDLTAGDIEGTLDVRSGDGDVTFKSVKGDAVNIKASDGDIKFGSIESNAIYISTSDGDLTLGKLKAKSITLKTSDGDVYIDELDSEETNVRSSDGDVTIEAAVGRIRARTSDGDISIGIGSGLEMELSTSDGDVYLSASSALAVSLDLRGEHVSIHGRHDFDGDMSNRRVKGKLGGGGPLIMARTSDGSVSLDLR